MRQLITMDYRLVLVLLTFALTLMVGTVMRRVEESEQNLARPTGSEKPLIAALVRPLLLARIMMARSKVPLTKFLFIP